MSSSSSSRPGRLSLSFVTRVAFVAMTGATAAAITVTSTPAVAAGDYVECRWAPYHGAWACTLPAAFTQGRFGPPPEYKSDEFSVKQRQQAFDDAKTQPGARARGRVGVFVPGTSGEWTFVPGTSWSPGEIVFLPPPPKAETPKTAKR